MKDTMTIEEAFEIESRLYWEAHQACNRLKELYEHGVRLVDRSTLEPVVPDNVVVLAEHRSVQ